MTVALSNGCSILNGCGGAVGSGGAISIHHRDSTGHHIIGHGTHGSQISVEPLPTTRPMDHSYAGVSVSSGSVTTTEQVKVMSFVTLMAGTMASPLKVGGILHSDAGFAHRTIRNAIVGVTRTVHCSFLLVADGGTVLEVCAD